MLSYSHGPAVAEAALLILNQAVPRSRLPSGVGRRALRRGLSKAAARIERSSDYQRSLVELSRLAESFQACLAPAQLGQWLLLEEAMLEHVARLNRSYFYAGAAWGKQIELSQRGAVAVSSAAPRATSQQDDTEALIALARLVSKLTERQ